jgi:hypothetical protein
LRPIGSFVHEAGRRMQGRIQRGTNDWMAAERTTCCASEDKVAAEVPWKIVSRLQLPRWRYEGNVQDKVLGSQRRSEGVDRLAGGGGAWPRKALEVLPRRSSSRYNGHNTISFDLLRQPTPCSGCRTASASLFDPSGPSTGYP